ncbi:toll/interleukin-1 receptor domain-containing protein [Mesorhizobium sp.]|uniref:toll/interleukin-1 receptor domain-containing protein n=1 Tax=Mesorhizobium sp. TaxID=1871066 RepID=UPI000FE58362|nr:toll/interleukin-1 receptor domain-containing protein [Mesorhizobium sp.]RWE79578.1 MAG: TIR domain-containing protein [Mesorhizobium sp.]
MSRKAGNPNKLNSGQIQVGRGRWITSNLLTKVRRGLVGYDMFISYARRDASAYADTLAKKLHQRYACFIDLKEAAVGSPLADTIQDALDLSRTLVLVCSEGATSSRYVSAEVAYFLTTGRPIIAIDIDDVLDRSPWSILRKRIFVDDTSEALTSGHPSGIVLDSIKTSFTITRRAVTRRRAAIAAAAIALILVGGAMLALNESRNANRIAALQGQLAAQQTASRKANVLVAVGERLVEADPTKAIEFALASARYSPEQAAVSLIRRALLGMPQFQAVKVEDRPSHDKVEVLSEDFRGVNRIFLVHGGSVAIVYHADGGLTSWEIANGKLAGTISSNPKPVIRTVLVESSETKLFALFEGGKLNSIQVHSDGSLTVTDVPGVFRELAGDMAQTQAVAWSQDGTVRDLARGRDVRKVAFDPQGDAAATLYAGGQALAVLSPAGEVQLIDLLDGKVSKFKVDGLGNGEIDRSKSVRSSITFLPAATALIVSVQDDYQLHVVVIDATTGKAVWTDKESYAALGVDAERSRFGLLSGAVTQYDVRRIDGELKVNQSDKWDVLPRGDDAGEPQGLVYGPFGRYVATLSAPIMTFVGPPPATAVLWYANPYSDTRAGDLHRGKVFAPRNPAVLNAAFDRRGEWLATFSIDGWLRIWNVFPEPLVTVRQKVQDYFAGYYHASASARLLLDDDTLDPKTFIGRASELFHERLTEAELQELDAALDRNESISAIASAALIPVPGSAALQNDGDADQRPGYFYPLPSGFNKENGLYDPVEGNTALSELVEDISINQLRDRAEILRRYAQAIRQDPLLLSGMQQKYIWESLQSSGQRQRTALVLAALSGMNSFLPMLQQVITTTSDFNTGELAKWSHDFLVDEGRSLTVGDFAPTDVDMGDWPLVAVPKTIRKSKDWQQTMLYPWSDQLRSTVVENYAAAGVATPVSRLALVAILTGGFGPLGKLQFAMCLKDAGALDAALSWGMLLTKDSKALSEVAPGSLENLIGYVLYLKKDEKQSIVWFEKAAASGRDDGWPERNIANAMIDLGQVLEAQAFLEEAYKKALARYGGKGVGSQHELAGFANALAWYLSAQKLQPSVADLEEAERLARLADKLEANEPGILDTLAMVLASQGKYRDAIDVERRAIQLVSSNSERSAYQNKIDTWNKNLPPK